MTKYVDTETNTCIFGYGAVAPRVIFQVIHFKEIAPPVGPGTKLFDGDYRDIKIGTWEYTGNELHLLINDLDEANTIEKLLDEVERNSCGIFKFKNITFDFTKYNQKSMDSVKYAVYVAKMNLMRVIAC